MPRTRKTNPNKPSALRRRKVRNIARGLDAPTRYYGVNPFPPILQARLKYSDMAFLTNTGSSVSPYVFKANSAYDPSLTATGHQPRLFDQFCSSTGPYTTYRVVGFHIKLEIQNTFQCNNAQSYAAVVAMGPSLSSTAPAIPTGSLSSVSTFAEIPNWQTCLSSITPCVLRASHRVAEMIGRSEQCVQDDVTLSAPYSADPTYLVYWQIQCQQTQGTDGGSNQFYVDLKYDIELDVQFENRIVVAPS